MLVDMEDDGRLLAEGASDAIMVAALVNAQPLLLAGARALVRMAAAAKARLETHRGYQRQRRGRRWTRWST